MWFHKCNNTDIAFRKIKTLQQWLNKTFPDKPTLDTPDLYAFEKAEDFLTSEAREWRARKKENQGLN